MARSTPADDRDAVGADDRDEHHVPRARARRGLDEVPSLRFVASGAARAVHDDVGTLDRRFDPVACSQIAPHELDARLRVLAMPAQHAHLPSRLAQPRHDEAPEDARPARDQDGSPFVPMPSVARRRLIHAGVLSSFGHIGLASLVSAVDRS
jgi:hypothetical protein